MIRATQRGVKRSGCYYCLFGVNKIVFYYFHFNILFGMLLKGIVESSILSKDEPLTPNVHEVMTFHFFRRRALKAKTGKSWTS